MTASNVICTEGPPNAAFAPSANNVSSLDAEIEFINNTTGAVSYVWDFGDGSPLTTEEEPTHTYNETDAYFEVILVATSPLGCVDTAYSSIHVYEELIYYIPNTFTPDQDQFNNTFQPVFTSGYDPFDFTLLIFNRWGELIFESHNAEIGWDGSYNGTLVQDGTYTWKIEFKVSASDKRIMDTGHVNMIK
jgi:gliding motility-associated-like protein